MTDDRVLVLIHGRVQGVGYRRWLQQMAEEHRLRGWTRNRRDGSVEALLIGHQTVVDDALSLIWKGPPAAEVQRVERMDAPDEHAPAGFEVRPDA
ncbi:acylphosphatase [Terrihabitans rhizophilus]|uniref:acylphosphatase n=1 Tax=Terrihabitans rhizophilus TaxID=3092662 RepID=A0ABU4RN64_9HYPH|nr:acylphosphatase [Terrihabitans sp. PJ23]MDX6805150.1 acylphosphatase [Terrihabitans sp. PJ23]